MEGGRNALAHFGETVPVHLTLMAHQLFALLFITVINVVSDKKTLCAA